ncbi:MAG: transposon-encoded TnpW family protein [Oscillospiraceae bacterium]|nr:transposon-encoded TnpW family protein [Oscillospiraceae bacterium]
MQDNLSHYENSHKPLIDTGREPLVLSKYPKDLDFTKIIGGTTYTVKSHFNPNANESMLRIILRWLDSGADVSEQ